MQLPFYLSLLGMTLLYITLWRYEMAVEEHLGEAALAPAQARRRRRGRPRRPHRGAEPPHHVILAQTTNALPDNTGYVAAAYLVFFALVLIYVVIMASKLARFERELDRAQRPRRRALRDGRPGDRGTRRPEEPARR